MTKKGQIQDFASQLGIRESFAEDDQNRIFLIAFAGPKWSEVYRILHVYSPDLEFSQMMDSSSIVNRLSSSEEELPEEDLRLAIKQLKRANELLEKSALAQEKDILAFSKHYPQIASFKDCISTHSTRLGKIAAGWSPLEMTKRFMVAMHTHDFEILWEKLYNDSTGETKTALQKFRKTNKNIKADEFASLLSKYLY